MSGFPALHDVDTCCCSYCRSKREYAEAAAKRDEGDRARAALNALASGEIQPTRIWAPAERSSVATEAHAAVYGDRGKDYGHPRDNFTDTARIWNALLADKLTADITAEDVARCMIGVKLARDLHSPKRDNRVDIAGYAITLDRLETGL